MRADARPAPAIVDDGTIDRMYGWKWSMIKRTILFVIGIIFMVSASGFCGSVDLDFRLHRSGNAALRSALLPGWGQFFNRQSFKGEVLGTIFFASLGGYLYFTGVANKDYRDYETKGLRSDSLYSDYETHQRQASFAVGLAAGTWVISVVDAYIFGTPRRAADDQQLSSRAPGLQWACNPDGASLQRKWYFQ